MVVRPFGNHIAVDDDSSEIKTDEGLGIFDGSDLGEVIERENDPSRKNAMVEDEGDDVLTAFGATIEATKKPKKPAVGGEPVKTEKTTASSRKATISSSSKQPKKKRKKGDAFDDLFASLV